MKGDILVEQKPSMLPPHNKYHLTYENMFLPNPPPPFTNHYLLTYPRHPHVGHKATYRSWTWSSNIP